MLCLCLRASYFSWCSLLYAEFTRGGLLSSAVLSLLAHLSNDWTRTYYPSILKRKKEERRPEENHRAQLLLARKLHTLSPSRDLAQHSCGNQHMVAPSPEPGGSKDIYRCRPRVSWEVISTWEDHSSVHSVTLLAQLVRASAARKPWAFAISAAAKAASGDSRRNTRSPSPYRRHRYQ